MKKNNTLENNVHHDLIDEELLTQINTNLNKVNQVYPIFTPELEWFQQMAESQQLALRKKLKKDLLIFSLCALFILSGVFISLIQAPKVFFIIQGLVSLSAPVIVYLQYRKERVMDI
ncbi:YxlC family protein [Litchfieldia salsa]|uniref:YxlC family protein n=1 Tax=Litchfieldia salsa TaxID=930152 RepID=A0A1H0UZ89_9BACI|nr:YxlC family protein [Litchfieldia salsa]SDP71248.1 hypothetical protein SAMN05216565_105254 [Litchfieldia salsa]